MAIRNAEFHMESGRWTRYTSQKERLATRVLTNGKYLVTDILAEQKSRVNKMKISKLKEYFPVADSPAAARLAICAWLKLFCPTRTPERAARC